MANEKTEHKIDRDNRFGRPIEWVAAAGAGLSSGYYAFRKLVRTKYHEDAKNQEGTADLFHLRKIRLADAKDQRILDTLDIFEKKFGKTDALAELISARDAVIATSKKSKGAQFTPEMIAAKGNRAAALQNFLSAHEQDLATLTNHPEFIAATERYITNANNIKVTSDKAVDALSEFVIGFRSKGVQGHLSGLVQRFRSFGNYSRTDILLPTLGAMGAAFAVVTMAFNQFNTRAKLNANDKATGEANERLDTVLKKIDAIAQDQKEEALHLQPDLQRARASQSAKIKAERAAQSEFASELGR